MCGRYSLLYTWRDLRRLMVLVNPADEPQLALRYNVAPTQDAPVIRAAEGGALVESMRLGLIPSWADGPLPARPCINARSETAATSRVFAPALSARRCIVPASGFYEWRRGAGPKRPHYIQRADTEPMLMAGLWERSHPSGAGPVLSFAVLTRVAAGPIAELHDRMPVIVDPSDAPRWLDGSLPPGEVQSLIAGPPPDLTIREVSPWVNAASHEGPRCHEPPPPEAGGLWPGA
jgi:putative SOS response-associated peptidase YedK